MIHPELGDNLVFKLDLDKGDVDAVFAPGLVVHVTLVVGGYAAQERTGKPTVANEKSGGQKPSGAYSELGFCEISG